MLKKILLSTLLISSISFSYADESELYNLKNLSSKNIAKLQKEIADNKIPTLRAEAIKDIALRLGSSAGLAHEFKKYEEIAKKKSAEYDRIYDFEKLKLSAGVLPPVLSQGFSNFDKKNDDRVEISAKNMSIESNARIVSTYPTWRDYLTFDFKPAELPQANFMPKTKAEKKLWDKYIEIGWSQGVQQAQEIYQEAFARLNRDYNGMIQYKISLGNNMVVPTIVASSKLGDTVSKDGKSISIGHEVIQITNHSTFKNSKDWKNKYPATYQSLDGKIY